MRVTILSGFLGSGKTTLLRRLLRECPPGLRLGVLVNDLSDLEVDGDLVREAGRLSEADGSLVSLYAGTLSGGQRAAFQEALAKFAARTDLDHLLVETSGGSHPWPMIQDILTHPQLQLRNFITLLDTRALVADHGGGLGLLRTLAANEESGQRSTENLLAEQVQFASAIVLTKAERIPPDALALVRKTVEILHPQARVLTASYGKTGADLLAGDGFDWEHARRVAAALGAAALRDPAPGDIGHTIVRDERPLHPGRLWRHFRENLGLGIHRSKGFIWLASRPDQVLLWNQSGGSIELELMAYWKAALVNDPASRLLPEEIDHLRGQLRNAHPVFGDRLNELTLIGAERDREIFVRGLQQCFCTDAEIAQWQAGQPFDDPWPKTLRQVS
jgi:G3E family GTPase